MKTVTERKYINQMLPHLLPLRAKKLGIRQENKEEWSLLAKQIKEELLERYSVATNCELLNDISYKRRKAKKGERPQKSDKQTVLFDNITNEIVNNIPDISYSRRNWIKKTRIKLLNKFKEEENQILRELILQKVNIFHKMPFIISGNIYFADIFLPDQKIIIEVINERTVKNNDRSKIKKRLLDLNSTGNKLITISYEKAKNKNFIHTLIHLILQQSII